VTTGAILALELKGRSSSARFTIRNDKTLFSASFGINVETLRNWEQGKRPLNEFTANFLKVIEEDPAMDLKVIRRAS